MLARAEIEAKPLYEIRHTEGWTASVFRSPEEASLAGAGDALSDMAGHLDELNLGATGNTFLHVWPAFIAEAKRRDFPLAKLKFGHLDNYVWDPAVYPHPGPEDFGFYMYDNLIAPAGIPFENFYLIDGYTNKPDIAAASYDKWVNRETLNVVFFGIGPAPEYHLAYLLPHTPRTTGYHVVSLSEATKKRNALERKENTPDIAISAGWRQIQIAKHKKVFAFGKPDAIRATLVDPPSEEVIASQLRGMQDVHFYLDEASAKPLEGLR